MEKVRIDKWLWAARFFKTRSIAKQAIEGGKVHANGQRVKASKDISTGMLLTIRQGFDEKVVEVIALSDQRRGADIAQTLYRETEESIARREQFAAERKASNATITHERPNKKQRRQIHRFIRESQD
ncbi:RNA-binding S4 domain-containing protein [Microbulbifer hydrolyticus]|uniref:Heat shock protein 15 n=1 Tax=Microbulbifer hydrolyticus TaxID=48074 RepID=A0A6P1T7N1_9GAMM|nr:S4 domain-containing protein [Microbulbifer hydrolyticus]MBB5211557.1 ribosome-associated heat shock protein Hsp15 [Microbulbifer hydrolyticus]QHQ37703.1 RNA-binding protein [Microbulbifer hydrolyticus]